MSEYKRLYEIPDFLNKKVTACVWDNNSYLYYDHDYRVWMDKDGEVYDLLFMLAAEPRWKEWGPPKGKKVTRYWKWISKDSFGVFNSIYYLNEDGFYTNGHNCPQELVTKIENDWIDVDEDGNIVAASWESENENNQINVNNEFNDMVITILEDMTIWMGTTIRTESEETILRHIKNNINELMEIEKKLAKYRER